jgi:hypothetical protein
LSSSTGQNGAYPLVFFKNAAQVSRPCVLTMAKRDGKRLKGGCAESMSTAMMDVGIVKDPGCLAAERTRVPSSVRPALAGLSARKVAVAQPNLVI